MMLIKATPESEAGAPPSPKLMEVSHAAAAQLTQAGIMLFTGGLLPSSDGVRLRVADGKLTQIDGPFAEATELVGGFAVFEVKSKDEAIQHGRRYMAMIQEVAGPGHVAEMEIRQIFGPSDLPQP
ncbi:MAG: YciI family protein [Myxococcales bacterium]|nr:YciI family protein [Myxococcales bacterium]